MGKLVKIPRQKVSEEVADRLQDWIRSGFTPGDRLPPERELVEKFGVSRSSIRDAIHRLQQDGLVETRHGLGTVVSEPVRELAVVPISQALKGGNIAVAELMDFRRIVEPPLAARAAVRATDVEITAMRRIVERQELKVRQKIPAVAEDKQFHYAIALAAKNSVVLQILDTLMNLLLVTREEQFQSPLRSLRSHAGHVEILAAIERRDPGEAASAMQRHLDEVEVLIDPAAEAATDGGVA